MSDYYLFTYICFQKIVALSTQRKLLQLCKSKVGLYTPSIAVRGKLCDMVIQYVINILYVRHQTVFQTFLHRRLFLLTHARPDH